MSGYRTFQYRMPAGFPGDVTRMTPAAIIEPCASDPTTPPPTTGLVVCIDATSGGIRPPAAATDLPYGVTVRAYPKQPMQASGFYGASSFGAVNPMQITGQPRMSWDVGRLGYFLMPVLGATKKGGTVHVWFGAAGGGHVPGGLEAAGTVGSTYPMTPGETTFNGVPDANGMVEVAWNVGASVGTGASLLEAEAPAPPQPAAGASAAGNRPQPPAAGGGGAASRAKAA